MKGKDMVNKDNAWVMISILFFAVTKIVALICAAVIAIQGNMWIGAGLFVAAIVFRITWTFTPTMKEMENVNTNIIKQILKEVVTVLYLNDSSDFKSALWKILELSGGQSAVDLMHDDDLKAWNTYVRIDKP